VARTAVLYLSPSDSDTALADARAQLATRLEIVAVITEGTCAQRPPAGMPTGLGEALSLIAAGDARTLVCSRLQDLARSAGQLLALVDWIESAGGDLVVLDVHLDSASQAGARTLGLLRELARLEREGDPSRRPRGRPNLSATAPELGERILALRGRALSLQAIADTLNAEGVPTHRGGAKWRPSSVQSALGYRRPQPPLPGAPPPPPSAGPPRPPGPHTPPRGPKPKGPRP